MSSPSEVVQRFIDAVISRDIGSIPKCFSTDAVFTAEGVGIVGTGREEIESYYAAGFEKYPAMRVELVNRLAIGRVVVDHESVTGVENIEAAEWIWVYIVEDDLITTMYGVPA